jgi:RNA polymerase sigma factor (sigma-70 family)
MMESQSHDMSGFQAWAKENTTYFYSRTLALCGNRWLAEDLIQTYLMKAWKAWPDPIERAKYQRRGHATTSIKHGYFDFLRQPAQKRRSALEDDMEFPCSGPPVDEQAVFADVSRRLWKAVAELDPTLRELVLLVYVDGYSVRRAAGIIGLCLTTAYRYRDLALEELKKRLES